MTQIIKMENVCDSQLVLLQFIVHVCEHCRTVSLLSPKHLCVWTVRP